jgi:hypothetical protein
MQFWPNLQAACLTLLTSGIASWLVAIGSIVFGAFAVSRIAMFGARMTNGAHPNWVADFIELLIPIAIGTMLLQFWAVPIPGVGVTMPEIVTGSTQLIVRRIGLMSIQDISVKLTTWQNEMESPGLASFVAMFEYGMILTMMWACQAIGFVVMALSLVATAVCILEAPLFISTMLWPDLEFAYRGWLRSFLQYATMPITCSVIISIMGEFLVNSITAMPHKSSLDVATNVVPIVMVLAANIAAVGLSPWLHTHLWTGSAGSSTGFIGALVTRFTR